MLPYLNQQIPPPPPRTPGPRTYPYAYTTDLLSIASHINPSPPPLPPTLCKVTTPLCLAAWEFWLSPHPDRAYAQYLTNGISQGFRIGFAHTTQTCHPARSNHPSAFEHPEVVSKALATEVAKGRLIGPLDPQNFPYVQISSLGTTLKKHTQNKWRLILDLSHPKGRSVNDGINRTICSLKYMKVDDVVQRIISSGRSTLIAKIDIESAFRNIPVHPHDRHLLGMVWHGELFVDTVLPFGLRSAPKIFNSIADGLQWVAIARGTSYLDHFLDDYITIGSPHSNECARNLGVLIDTCSILRLPIAPDKLEGPSTCLTFLGIELDTVRLELRLPLQKLHRLQLTLHNWSHSKHCVRADLDSLVGLLHDASIVVRPGRTFIRRLIDLLKATRNRPARGLIRINREARSDILWWHSFIQHWNGLSMMRPSRRRDPDVVLTSDASGSWGCGAYSQAAWFQYQWSAATTEYHITAKELLPIVIAAAIWGKAWAGKSILCRCDNEAVVYIINSGTSKDPTVMGLMRCLYFICAKFNLLISAVHLAGIANSLADALSRNKLPIFLLNHPQANQAPSPIPAPLLDILIHTKPDWTSPSWSSTFNSIFSPPCPRTPYGPTPPATADTSTSAPALAHIHTPQPSSCSANLSDSLASNTSNTKPSNATYPASASSTSSTRTQTPSSATCPDFTTFSAELNQSKRRKIAPHDHASQ